MEAMTRPMLLILLCIRLTVSSVVDLQRRIIGGEPCERQYHVRLRVAAAAGGGSSSLCGSSLISDRWILTAAHCLKSGRIVFAVLGEHQEVKITAEPVIYADKDNRSHDIMLLQLPSPSDILPIALPDCKYRPRMVEIAGHAATTGGLNDEREPGASPSLHCADVKVVACEDLENALQKDFQEEYQVKAYQRWFCGQAPKKDICYGDSGGGVVYEGKIYGVISFLGDPDRVCTTAAAFMDLCHPEYAAWISQTIKGDV